MTTPTDSGLAVEQLCLAHRFRGLTRTVVEDVSFEVHRGQTLGLIGASGAGKSTIGLAVAGLLRPAAGGIRIAGADPMLLARHARRRWRRLVHIVFQNPYEALAPTMTVAAAVAEPLAIAGTARRAERRERALAALEAARLVPAERYAERRATQLSGGELQRAALARAMLAEPTVLVADEPTGMLDAGVREELLELLAAWQRAHATAILLITHDVALARENTDRLAVLDRGRLVESGATPAVLDNPSHPATRALLHAHQRLHTPKHTPGNGVSSHAPVPHTRKEMSR